MFRLRIDKFWQNFSPLRGRYIVSIVISYTPVCHSTFLNAEISAATRQYQIQALATREYNFLNKKNVFLSVELVKDALNSISMVCLFLNSGVLQ